MLLHNTVPLGEASGIVDALAVPRHFVRLAAEALHQHTACPFLATRLIEEPVDGIVVPGVIVAGVRIGGRRSRSSAAADTAGVSFQVRHYQLLGGWDEGHSRMAP